MLDPLIHQETRLRLIVTLARNRELSFTRACEALGLTPGNLGSHAQRLEAAGYIASRRALNGLSFELRYRLTEKGEHAWRAYLDALRGLLHGGEGAAGAPADEELPADRPSPTRP